MGESITEGTVADILKQPGEALAADDIILQIETDKVTIDVRAPQQGVLTSLKVCLGGGGGVAEFGGQDVWAE